MPSKSIAGILNNESNLRILEKLKEKPYYPRELAGEMKLSEPFIVRRLKAMEEHDIVEGRWETENGRKVKRYYVKDITMELGKDGLRVTSGEAPAKSGIDLKKDLLGLIIKLPLIAFIMYGMIFDVPAIIVVTCIYLAWSSLDNAAFYRTYRLKSVVIGLILTTFTVFLLMLVLFKSFADLSIRGITFPIVDSVVVILLIFLMSYRSRFYQLEIDDLIRYKREFISGLGDAPFPVKIFYLPMALRWKLSEYFNLV